MTRYAEVIGDPIAQSKSPLIHRFWLEQLGLPGDYRREHVRAGELADHLAARQQDPDWLGCNVTVPHKQAVLPLVDRLTPLAENIGAVNTIVRDGEALVGHNSDAPGFLEPLAPLLAERHLLRTARILGAGGAARAIAHALWAERFTLIIAARDHAKAEALRAEFAAADSHAVALDHFADALDFDWGDCDGRLDLLVNATTLGMTGLPPLRFDLSHLPPGAIVYDIVYAPLETPLLAAARAGGHRTIDGLSMLIGQAAVAFELFFGVAAPRAHDAELRALLTA